MGGLEAWFPTSPPNTHFPRPGEALLWTDSSKEDRGGPWGTQA